MKSQMIVRFAYTLQHVTSCRPLFGRCFFSSSPSSPPSPTSSPSSSPSPPPSPPPLWSETFLTSSEQEMSTIGKALAASTDQPGDVVLLYGDLGSGKTVLSRAFVRRRTSVPNLVVTSPTFTIESQYRVDGRCTRHLDLYRIQDPAQLQVLDLLSAYTSDTTVIEWPDRLHYTPYMPRDYIRVVLRIQREPIGEPTPHLPSSPTLSKPDHDSPPPTSSSPPPRSVAITLIGSRWTNRHSSLFDNVRHELFKVQESKRQKMMVTSTREEDEEELEMGSNQTLRQGKRNNVNDNG